MLAFLQNGDHLAFAEIYRRYYRDVYHYLMVVVKVTELAEDLTQEVFLKLWEIRGQVRIERSFRGYLFRISHNKAVDTIKKIAAESGLKDQLLHQYKMAPAPENIPQEQQQKYDQLVEKALDTLSPQRRKVFEMSKIQKKSYEEIARELGISINTVKVHVSRTLSILRDYVLQNGELYIILLFLYQL